MLYIELLGQSRISGGARSAIALKRRPLSPLTRPRSHAPQAEVLIENLAGTDPEKATANLPARSRLRARDPQILIITL